VRWAGDPRKPVAEDDPDHLSPRRSFAVWTELVRSTALPWSEQELTMAGMLQASMADLIQQVHAVRVFIAEQQLTAVRRVVDHSAQPMVIIDAGGSVVLLNRAFRRLAGREADGVEALEDVALCFAESERLPAILERVRAERRSWSGELSLLSGGRAIPVAVRVDMVPWLENAMLGYIILVGDLTVRREAEETRRRLERTLHEMAADRSTWAGDTGPGGLTSLLEAITENARLAAMHGSEHTGETVNTFVLDDIDRLTRRAAELTRQMLTYAARTRRL
jgi:PAS domain S-box-containing protein